MNFYFFFSSDKAELLSMVDRLVFYFYFSHIELFIYLFLIRNNKFIIILIIFLIKYFFFRIAEEFAQTPLDDNLLAEQILANLSAQDNSSSHSFAVRSSAVGEDGAEFSGAGQLETFLEVPVDEVCQFFILLCQKKFCQHVF